MPEQPFWKCLEQFGESVALIAPDGSRLRYGELAASADAFAARFADAGRRLVLIGSDNSTECIVAYLGALRAGHTVLLVDGADRDHWTRLVDTYRPDPWFPEASGAGSPGDRSGHALHPDLVLLLSTSGSSGSPKCVRLSLRNLDSNARAIAEYLRLRPDDRALLTLPLHYVYGLSVLHSHLAAGASVVTGLHTLTSSAFFDRLREHAATSFATVPFSFEMLERSGFREQAFPALRYVTQAGGRLHADLVLRYGQWAQATQKRFYVMYGQTEASPRMAWLPPELTTRFPSSIGIEIPGGKLEVRGEEGAKVLEPGEVGELVYSGPNVMQGYASRPEDLTRGQDVSELATGDMGYRSPDGLFFLVGRRSRFSKLYGKRLNLDDAEAFLREISSPAVCVSNDRVIFLVTAGSPVSPEAMGRFAESFQIAPADVHCVDLPEWPMLASGKLDHREILRMAESDQAARAREGGGDGLVGGPAAVRAAFEKHFPDRNVRPEDTFVGLEGDSLTYVGTSLALEKCLGHLPSRWEEQTVAQLEEMARTAAARPARAGVDVETGVLIRAIAPVLVVLNHSGLPMFKGGAQLLLLLAGLQFARFQVPHLLAGRTGKVLGRFAESVLLPYWLILIGYQLWRRSFSLPDVVLLNNFIGRSTRTLFETWFVQALLQSILLVCLLLAIPAARRRVARRPYRAAAVFLALAVAVRLCDEFVWPGWLDTGGRQLTWVLWLFALGMVLQFRETPLQRRWLTLIAVVAPLALYAGDPARIVIIVGGCLALLWIPRCRVPGWSLPVLEVLGSASLFIYLLHGVAPLHSFSSGWPVDVVRITVGIVVGVVGWWLYDSTWRRIAGWMRARFAARAA